MILDMEMRDRVKKRMTQLGLNEAELVRRMGQNGNGTIWSLLSGRTRTFRDTPKLAEALETSSEWLLTGREALADRFADSQSPRAIAAEPQSGTDPRLAVVLREVLTEWESQKKRSKKAASVDEIVAMVTTIYDRDKNLPAKEIRAAVERLMQFATRMPPNR